jgi:hypothetical protein
MSGQNFWHLITLIVGLACAVYALSAKEFRQLRLFTTGDNSKFKPKWYDRAWLLAFGIYFFINAVLFFIRHKAGN